MEETTEDFDDSDEEPIQFQVFTQKKTKTKTKTKRKAKIAGDNGGF